MKIQIRASYLFIFESNYVSDKIKDAYTYIYIYKVRGVG